MSRPARPGFVPRPRAIAALASALLGGLPAAALAQSSVAPEPEHVLPVVTATAAKTRPGSLNDTTTTGTKTDTPLRDVPAASTVIP